MSHMVSLRRMSCILRIVKDLWMKLNSNHRQYSMSYHLCQYQTLRTPNQHPLQLPDSHIITVSSTILTIFMNKTMINTLDRLLSKKIILRRSSSSWMKILIFLSSAINVVRGPKIQIHSPPYWSNSQIKSKIKRRGYKSWRSTDSFAKKG